MGSTTYLYMRRGRIKCGCSEPPACYALPWALLLSPKSQSLICESMCDVCMWWTVKRNNACAHRDNCNAVTVTYILALGFYSPKHISPKIYFLQPRESSPFKLYFYVNDLVSLIGNKFPYCSLLPTSFWLTLPPIPISVLSDFISQMLPFSFPGFYNYHRLNREY